jgi:hypothetical protein
MFKRFMLGLTFLVALSAVGLGVTEKTEAWGRWRRPYVSYYQGPPGYYDDYYSGYYGSYPPYRTYYYYGPRYRYYGSYYDGYYYDSPGVYFRGPRGRVAFRVGW